jgi:hypothetical protein
MRLSGISGGVTCIQVPAQSWHLGVRMSSVSSSYLSEGNASPALSEGKAAPALAVTNTAASAIQLARVADPAAHFLPMDPTFSPVNGLVGRCFIRMCLWVDLVTSWSRRNRPLPQWSPELALGGPITPDTTEPVSPSTAN